MKYIVKVRSSSVIEFRIDDDLKLIKHHINKRFDSNQEIIIYEDWYKHPVMIARRPVGYRRWKDY
jgi:hypothetical protein